MSGINDAFQILEFMLQKVKKENVTVSLTFQPENTEISVSPYESYVPRCPYEERKQESNNSVEPTVDDNGNFNCGYCGEILSITDRFCSHCGRRLKWDD